MGCLNSLQITQSPARVQQKRLDLTRVHRVFLVIRMTLLYTFWALKTLKRL